MSPQQQCQNFLASRKSILLSSQNAEGVLETSVTPFILLQDRFYIFVSELAQHTQNLLWLSQQSPEKRHNISGLLVADESETEQLFARERLSFQFSVQRIEQDNELYNQALQLFSQQFGEVVEVLKGLPDFHLFALNSESGGYVRGFGQAFAFNGMPSSGISAVKR